MEIVSRVLTVVLALVCVASAAMDFRRPESLVATMTKLKVPVERLPLLGIIKCLAAVGLLAGWGSDHLSLVVGVCLSAYFAVATATHLRVRDAVRDTFPAFMLLVLSLLFSLTTIAR